MSDWVKLNVGGQIFQTTRTTLLSEPNSMLANMLTNDQLEKDDQGNYFDISIDRSPKYFEPLLNYLRYRKLIIDPGVNVQGVYEEAKYFGIESAIPDIEKMLQLQGGERGFQAHIKRKVDDMWNDLDQIRRKTDHIDQIRRNTDKIRLKS